MYLTEVQNSPMGWNDTTWMGATTARKEIIINDIENMNLDLQDKKVLCLAGGIGRNANALRRFGCQVTNSDIRDTYIKLGKKTYPDIKHFIYDIFDNPIPGYDFVVIENFWCNRLKWKNTIECAQRWKDYATVLPLSMKLKIYKFNSKLLTDHYHQEEEVGNKFIQTKLNSGKIEGRLNKSEVENLVIENIEISTLNPVISIEKCNSHDYQMLGYDSIGLPNHFRGLIVNNGLHEKF